jgi:hypothetical protein
MGRARGNFFGGAAVRQAVVVIAFRYEVRRNDAAKYGCRRKTDDTLIVWRASIRVNLEIHHVANLHGKCSYAQAFLPIRSLNELVGVLQVEGIARDRENNDTRYGVESSESDLDRRAKHMRFLDAGVEPTGTK